MGAIIPPPTSAKPYSDLVENIERGLSHTGIALMLIQHKLQLFFKIYLKLLLNLLF